MTNSESGYSLVELVVVLLLLGIIALAVQSGLHFGGNVWIRSKQSIEGAHQLDMSQNVLRGLLTHSLPRLKGRYVTFIGEPKLLSFDAVPPKAFQPHGTSHIVLEIVRNTSSEQLRLTMTSLIDPSIKKQASIVEHAKGLRISYLDDSDNKATWLAYWRDRKKLPTAIRITTDDPTTWPELFIRPLIAQSAGCALDPVSMTCRNT